jgi:hypothetical protein
VSERALAYDEPVAARVDIDALLSLLREREHYSVPFVVIPPRGTSSAEISDAVSTAVAHADSVARGRTPDDPTWTTGIDPIPRGIAAELNDGPMSEEEIRAWFRDFAGALDDFPLRLSVKPLPPDRRVPTFEDWLDIPAPVTAFMSFSVVEGSGDRPRALGDERLREVLEVALDWTTALRGTTAVDIGLSSVVTRPDLAVAAVADQLPLDYQQVRVQRFTKVPRRLRFVAIDLEAQGQAQLADETASAREQYEAILQLLRSLGGWTDYTAVRRAEPVVPTYAGTRVSLAREPTEAECLTGMRGVWVTLADHVVDAYAAQVLTDRHLARVHDLSLYAVEKLQNGRYLVHAHDPDPWLASLDPDPDLWTRARAAFAPAQLTREAILASRAATDS